MGATDIALHLVDPSTMRGLEIGPLHRPIVRKSDGDVHYVDFYSTEELRERYRANSGTLPFLDDIVDVDYVVKQDDSLWEAAREGCPYDYVVASHVVEHIADPIGWFQGLERLLTPDGLVSLIVPDRRFSFDVNRSETRTQDWVDWYFRRLRAPSFGQLFDFFAHVTTIDGGVDTGGIWTGEADYGGVRRSDVPDADVAAFEVCRQYERDGRYIDVHVGIYTPSVFLELVELAMRLSLFNFEVAHFVSTPVDTLEFYVTLRRLPAGDLDRQLDSIHRARRVLESAPAPPQRRIAEPSIPEETGVPPGRGARYVEISRREEALILRKREVLHRARRAAGRLPPSIGRLAPGG